MNEQEILGLEDKRFAAMIAEDFGTLEALTHDELVYTHGHGGGDSKASWIETMRSGKTHYRKIVPGERKVRLFGDVALVTGRLDYELESKDFLKKRIEQAAKHVPLEDLCLSPQCGFSSTHHGNNLTMDEQWRKLERVIEVAQEVWR